MITNKSEAAEQSEDETAAVVYDKIKILMQ